MTNEERKILELALDWIEKQPEETPESKYDVDTRYVVIREIEAALAQPEQDWIERERAVGYREGHQNALKQMAQPEQEPVKLVSYNCKCGRTMNFESVHGVVAPQRKPLMDEQIYDMYNEPRSDAEMLEFARAIEAAHGIKE